MNSKIFISDIEAISPLGNILDELCENLFVNGESIKDKVSHINNFNFYKQGYGIKTRIDTSGKLCVHVTAKLASRQKEIENNRLGLITVSKYACCESKESYFNQLKTLEDKQYASPRDFVQSICNIPNALATIESKIYGFGNHLVGSSEATISALWQAAKCVNEHIVDKMIVTGFQVITEERINMLEASGFCYNNISDAAAGLIIQGEEKASDKKLLFEVLGFGFATNAKIEDAVEQAMNNVKKDSGIEAEDIQFVVSNANTREAFEKYEQKAVEKVINESVPIIMLKNILGECFAAYPVLALGILSRIGENILSSDLTLVKNEKNGYNNIVFGEKSVFMLITYDYTGSASAVCLKYC